MPIDGFWTFAALLLAGRKLALATGVSDYAEAMADLIGNSAALRRALKDRGLEPLAREMQRKGKAALAFTHPGPARDDAEAIFWQVAPTALANRDALAAADLNPKAACDNMIATIKASSLGPDFTATTLAERYFREVTVPLLETMLANTAYMTDLTPTLWTETLRRNGIAIRLLADVRDVQDQHTAMLEKIIAQTAPGLPLVTAQAILADFGHGEASDDPEEIARLLRNAAEQYKLMQERLLEYDNSSDQVIRDLSHAAQALIEQGRFDEADEKLEAVERHSDLVKAKTRAVRGNLAQLRLRYRDAADHFAKAAETVPPEDREIRWRFEKQRADALLLHGRVFGDQTAILEAIDLYEGIVIPLVPRVQHSVEWARCKHQLGNAYRVLAALCGISEYIRASLDAFQAAIDEYSRHDPSTELAQSLSSRGSVLVELGKRSGNPEPIRAGLLDLGNAFNTADALKDQETCIFVRQNIGDARGALGVMTGDPAIVRDALNDFRSCLKALPPSESSPQRAMVQYNLGITWFSLARLEPNEYHFRRAADALEEALRVRTRSDYSMDHAITEMGLADVYLEGARTLDPTYLQALTAIDEAISVLQTRSATFYSSAAQSLRERILKARRAQSQ